MSVKLAEEALARLLRTLEGNGEVRAAPIPECGVEPLLYEFLRSFLMWESSVSMAETAIVRLLGGVVDCNEIRIFLPYELSEMIGEKYPRSMERALRMHSALNELYDREHDVCVECLREMSKRDARAYLLSLEGVPSFVASRVLLLGLDGHAFPMDERLVTLLAGEGIVKKSSTVEAATNRMERFVHAGEAAQAYLAIEAWADTQPLPRKKRAYKRASKMARARPSEKSKE